MQINRRISKISIAIIFACVLLIAVSCRESKQMPDTIKDKAYNDLYSRVSDGKGEPVSAGILFDSLERIDEDEEDNQIHGLYEFIDYDSIESISGALSVVAYILLFVLGGGVIIYLLLKLLNGLFNVPITLLLTKKNIKDGFENTKQGIEKLYSRLDSIEEELKSIKPIGLNPDFAPIGLGYDENYNEHRRNPLEENESLASAVFEEMDPDYPLIIDDFAPFTNHSIPWDEAVQKPFALGDPEKYRLIFRSKNGDFCIASDIPMSEEDITWLLLYLNTPSLHCKSSFCLYFFHGEYDSQKAPIRVYANNVEINGQNFLWLFANSIDACTKYTSSQLREMLMYYFEIEEEKPQFDK